MANLDAVLPCNVGRQDRFNRARQVIVQARSGGAVQLAKAQHNPFLVRQHPEKSGQPPADNRNQEDCN